MVYCYMQNGIVFCHFEYFIVAGKHKEGTSISRSKVGFDKIIFNKYVSASAKRLRHVGGLGLLNSCRCWLKSVCKLSHSSDQIPICCRRDVRNRWYNDVSRKT